jgi:hypothetical protein
VFITNALLYVKPFYCTYTVRQYLLTYSYWNESFSGWKLFKQPLILYVHTKVTLTFVPKHTRRVNKKLMPARRPALRTPTIIAHTIITINNITMQYKLASLFPFTKFNFKRF